MTLPHAADDPSPTDGSAAGPGHLGYADPAYVRSLAAFGRPIALPRSGGWLLARDIPGTDAQDAIGPYPLFACLDWAGLPEDLAALADDLVSVTVVTDPFADVAPELLRAAFPDLVAPFHLHHVVDLDIAADEHLSRKLRYTARQALDRLTIEHVESPAGHLDPWTRLYDHLVVRHAIRGIRAFSRETFATLFAMPGVSLALARHEGEVVAGQIYLRAGEAVHCHLGAATPRGYELDAFHALDRWSLDHFAGEARWLDLGGGTGWGTSPTDGLARYKSRWATQTRPTWLAGKILDGVRSRAMETTLGSDPTWFPAYRTGAFG